MHDTEAAVDMSDFYVQTHHPTNKWASKVNNQFALPLQQLLNVFVYSCCCSVGGSAGGG